jgi:hypothetical protein
MTRYDQNVTHLVSDYVTMTDKLFQLAEDKGTTQNELNHILNEAAPLSRSGDGGNRKYPELLRGRFNISKVFRIADRWR